MFLARMTGNITISLIVAAAFVPLSVRDIIQGKTTVLKDLSCLAITTQNYHVLTILNCNHKIKPPYNPFLHQSVTRFDTVNGNIFV